MLSQEFPLPDLLRIWDSLFADSRRFSFLIYICTAMIMCVCWHDHKFVLKSALAVRLKALSTISAYFTNMNKLATFATNTKSGSPIEIGSLRRFMYCFLIFRHLRDKILENDFPSNVKLLQNFPPIDVRILITKASELCMRK